MTDASGQSGTLEVTPTHPSYVDGLGWTASGDLVAGEQLNSPDGQTLTVTANQDEPEPDGVAGYNFTVADDHTYFVSATLGKSDFVWVHNSC